MTVPSLSSAPINKMHVPINHLPGCSILLSGLNDIQHPSYLSVFLPDIFIARFEYRRKERGGTYG
jgi:hypothetical protein